MPSFAALDVDDSEIIPDLLAAKPTPEDHLGSTIIVDGCPVVGPAKFDLLKKFLLDKFAKVGPISDHHFPVDDEKQTKGYMFITYENGKAASQAVRTLNSTPLDKSHTLQVNLLGDYERLTSVPTEWKPPPKQEYKDYGNLKSWLLNELCRDQFALVYNDGEIGSVYWHNAVEPTIAVERNRWTEGWMRWSPRGTYLATMHQPGAILWVGEKFQRLGRFPHQGVKMIDFSPMERFMVSLSPSAQSSVTGEDQDRPMADVIIWDVQRCVSRREFTVPVESYPAFKWSYNDAYFACLREGYVVIYETETFRLLDKKRIGGGNIRDFSWSPTENILAYWVPESDNTPARVVLLEVPSRQEVCTKNLFSVAEICLTWHEQGDFLAVQVLRCAKKKVDNDKQVKYMGTYMNLEIVRMREKLYPVDQLGVKASITCFQWEPYGTRFAFLQTVSSGRFSVAIYDVPRGNSIREVATLEISAAKQNDLKWSPKGNMLVVAGLKNADGYLEFISANDGISLANGDHPMVSEIHWDPTGRYLSTVVSNFYQKNDNGVWFWNSVGRCLYKMPLNGLRSFAWRPRPPSLLSPEQLQNIKKNMSKYNTHFANEDKMLASKASRELLEKRQRLLSEFSAWKNAIIKQYQSEKAERIELRGTDTDNLTMDGQTEEELEIIISTVKQVVRRNTDD
ncbi:Eukaryotic translation initiation factor 3 subunit B [Fasciola hepatica]|uniref:Eukaryotic translation initiation factor 3 subunit B n=1 Tax=Fasciola hepatica TaxID=6192 RepID=A0A4E0RFT7_FASHE|nr:Eukaryotic translation initiation factor 3 subunit B [Fasciola hepatica]